MPCLTFQTNLSLEHALKDATKEQLLRTLTSLIAEELGKPEAYVLVAIHDNCTMSFGGTTEPLAHLQLDSLGFAKSPTDISAVLCTKLHDLLGIDPARIYIKFSDHPRDMYGWKGSTFG